MSDEQCPQSVATLPASQSCPICGAVLRGKQTVCSARCRIQRSMRGRAAKQTERDAAVRLKLREALALLEKPQEIP